MEWMKHRAAENQSQGPGPHHREWQLHGSARKSQAPTKQTTLVRWPPAGLHTSQPMLKHGLSGSSTSFCTTVGLLHHRHLTPVETVPLWHTWCPALMISCQQVLFLCHANQDHECLKESSWSSGILGLCCVPHSPWNAANFEAFCKPVGTTHLKTERNPLPSTLGGHQKQQIQGIHNKEATHF